MNILLWVPQVLAALLYGASGVMKVCTVGLIVPAAFHWEPALTVVAATREPRVRTARSRPSS